MQNTFAVCLGLTCGCGQVGLQPPGEAPCVPCKPQVMLTGEEKPSPGDLMYSGDSVRN